MKFIVITLLLLVLVGCQSENRLAMEQVQLGMTLDEIRASNSLMMLSQDATTATYRAFLFEGIPSGPFQTRPISAWLLVFQDNRLASIQRDETYNYQAVQADSSTESFRQRQNQRINSGLGSITTTPSNPVLVPDAYGPGVHMNRYGQAVQLEPEWGRVPGERLQIKPDAYGPGIHMDQYGRPVRERPWP